MATDHSGPERRLAAILAADVVGYSRLMHADDQATLTTLSERRALFSEKVVFHGGRIVNAPGDSILAEFPSAVKAVECAVELQRSLAGQNTALPENRRMQFRIGVNLGDVLVDAGGVYGDGVNIAARLESLATPGGICISKAVYEQVKNRLRLAIDDLGDQQVKNIAEPLRVLRILPDMRAVESPRKGCEPELTLADKPSIAVLPFVNMSGDPEQEYFADGVTEDIITELSRFHSLFVIARNSTFTYKGKAVDVRTVSKELGVRYVLEGSIRRAGSRLRVTGQLVDALTGNHIWAERYDRMLEDIFAVQEEITRSIVGAIAPQIEASEAAKLRAARPGNLNAYEIAVRARAEARAAFGEADRSRRERAIRLAQEALAIDPRCAAALATLAFAHWQHLYFRTAPQPEVSRDEGIAAARRAIALDGSEYSAHLWKGMLLFMSGQHEAGLADLRRAYELNPNDSLTLGVLGFCEAVAGNPQTGIEHASNALRLSPRDPWRYAILNALAWAYFCAGDYAMSAQHALEALTDAPHLPTLHLNLALNYVGLGEIEKARSEIETLRRLAPELLDERLAGRWMIAKPEYRLRASGLLRIAAGLEDPGAAEKYR
jgi:adenylate cyclase